MEGDSDDEEETPTPKKPIIDKKRANDSASKRLLFKLRRLRLIPPFKKKNDGKKVAHVVTHPVKQARKTQAGNVQ
ncbi:histone deacetylase HDT2-like [Impatiens glandulifera]|uniref:histone deacetylase HDT2-like n=1 Tax=Impatiens glandulifera TaxID=253017 RepID=UPI001FB14E3B|nr:histone deacetylase HDT2-like [Impatiens glandulifera]